MSPESTIEEFGNVPGSNSSNRLSLRYLKAQSGGYDFLELVWLQQIGEMWQPKLSISDAQFQAESLRRRWVSKLHSFNSNTAVAILQVGEADKPGYSYLVNYSWQSCNLENLQLQLLKPCANPFEPYAGG